MRGRALILNLPGSPTGASESLLAVIDILPHALDLLAGKTVHDDASTRDARRFFRPCDFTPAYNSSLAVHDLPEERLGSTHSFLTGGCLGRAGFNRKSPGYGDHGAGCRGCRHRCVVGVQRFYRGIASIIAGSRTASWACPSWQRRCWFWCISASLSARYATGRALSRAPPRLPIRWGYLYFCAVVAALSHLLLDYTTAYGLRLFEPFNYRWYSWDIVSIIEPVMLVALIAGLVLPSLFGLINQEIGVRSRGRAGRAGAMLALAVPGVHLGVRDYQHRRASLP